MRRAIAGCVMLDAPRRVLDEQPLLAVLAAAVTVGNLADHVIASAVAVAVAAAERAGIPARRHLRSGVDLLTLLGVAPHAAHRAARVGRAAHMLPALTGAQRLGGIGIEFADAIARTAAESSAGQPGLRRAGQHPAKLITRDSTTTTPAAP
ncbi:hypothetical protein ACXDF8_21140 [Mycolicibacterium sp. CBM1]